MISSFEKIEELFKEIDENLKEKVNLFVIGGAALLFHGLKPATKDIDLVVETKKEFHTLKNKLLQIEFETKMPTFAYKNINISDIFVREDFRIDLFKKTVCKKFCLSAGMIKRAKQVLNLNNISVHLCSNEDIFLFKTFTEREGDLEDCIALTKRGLDWKVILDELLHQIKISGNDVWITWVGERLDILQEKDINIPILKEVDVLREKYFEALENKKQ